MWGRNVNKSKILANVLLTLLLASTLLLVYTLEIVHAQETIDIRPDGSIDPPTAAISTVDNVTYTLTDNIEGHIIVGPRLGDSGIRIIIDGAGHTLQGIDRSGIGIRSIQTCTIKDITIKSFGRAIYAQEPTEVIECTLIDNNVGFSNDCTDNVLFGNTITNNNVGIDFLVGRNTVQGNFINQNLVGISTNQNGGNSYFDNLISNNGDGIRSIASPHATISGNIIENNENGIILAAHEEYENTNHQIVGNTIKDNGCGLDLYGAGNSIFHTNFIDNTNHVDISLSANSWNASYPSGGNYWSDYPGVDEYNGSNQDQLGTDGIGDTPYLINEQNQDNYPLMNPLLPLPTHPSSIISPISSFFYSPSNPFAKETITFNASNSYDVDDEIISYTWNFGDGTTSTQTDPITVHSYTTTSGAVGVTLTVTDNDGLTTAVTNYINIAKIDASMSISTISPSAYLGYDVNIFGTLLDMYGNPLKDETVVLYYSFSGITDWVPITSHLTDDLGYYEVMWIPPATGSFIIKAEWAGNTTYSQTTNTTTLSSLLHEDQYVFSVESNSTLSELQFDTKNFKLSFTATGPDGTSGYVKVTIAKDLVSNPANIKVFLDGREPDFSITSVDDSWLLTFEYLHSSHEIEIDLSSPLVTKFYLTINISGSGSTNPTVGVHTYDEGDTVSVTASAGSGWTFNRWLLDGTTVGSSSSYTIIIDDDRSLTAVFTQDSTPPTPVEYYDLTVSIEGQGTVNPSVGTHSYADGTAVPITATATSGWSLSHYLVDGENEGIPQIFAITMNEDHSLTAIFTQDSIPVEQYDLTVSIGGQGLVFPNVGTWSYDEDSEVSVTAEPYFGWKFDHWELDSSNAGSTVPYSVTMDRDHSLVAVFSWDPSSLVNNEIKVVVDGTTYVVQIASNSDINNFQFNPSPQNSISFSVEGESGTTGLCNVTIPSELMSGDFEVYLGDTLLTLGVDYTQTNYGSHYVLCINYNHSTHTIIITATNVIPEFPSWTILTLFLIGTLAVLELRKKLKKQ